MVEQLAIRKVGGNSQASGTTMTISDRAITANIESARLINRLTFRVDTATSSALNAALTALSIPVTAQLRPMDAALYENTAFLNFIDAITFSYSYNQNGARFQAASNIRLFQFLWFKHLYEGQNVWSYDFAGAGTRLVTFYFDIPLCAPKWLANESKSKKIITTSMRPEFSCVIPPNSDQLNWELFHDLDRRTPETHHLQHRDTPVTAQTTGDTTYSPTELTQLLLAVRKPNVTAVNRYQMFANAQLITEVNIGEVDVLQAANFASHQDLPRLNRLVDVVFKTVEPAAMVTPSQKELKLTASANINVLEMLAVRI